MKSVRKTLLVFCLLVALFLSGCEKNRPHKDGTYEGRGEGYNQSEPIVVSVTVQDGRIAEIVVKSHGESQQQVPQVESALEKIPGAMTKKNSTAVDGIAGATETSEGLKTAVEDAMAQAQD